jgi:hypothetical protein
MNVTFTLVFFAAISFAAISFAECAIDERSPLSMHFRVLLLIVGEGGNSREVRPARRPAHVRGPAFLELLCRAMDRKALNSCRARQD